ncbi:hypothetical protein BDB01DRAFT_830175 [Pilobolus umbonatus]|nr:hypothetical protein BDB01DRAFT_830175 [Pilobolus umbonatus]
MTANSTSTTSLPAPLYNICMSGYSVHSLFSIYLPCVVSCIHFHLKLSFSINLHIHSTSSTYFVYILILLSYSVCDKLHVEVL